MNGDSSESFVKNSTIMQSFNRGIAIHGSHRLNISNNVAFDVKGHTYFIEDGIEQENRFEENLCAYTVKSNSLLNTDTTPACYWITNPNNLYVLIWILF